MNGAMVRAALEDRKTQTRRVIKPQPSGQLFHTMAWEWQRGSLSDDREIVRCPYGIPGDRLWVRETFFAFGRWETRFNAKKGRDEWHFIDMTAECGKWYFYAASSAPDAESFRRSSIVPMWWKRPAIFMPRAASRIDLDMSHVRVQRLQAITEADAIAEGLLAHRKGGWHVEQPPPGIEGSNHFGFTTPSGAYRDLWESINGAESWAADPYVWVIDFKRIDPMKTPAAPLGREGK
jgi:hypothetical protein